jgi:acetolactate synthase-1/2/3 large subunit
VICVGYDLVEYAPAAWNPDGRKRIVHIDTQPAEVDAQYRPEVELIGDIDGIAAPAPRRGPAARDQWPRRRGAPRGPRDARPRRPPDALLEELAGAAPRAATCRSRRSGRSPTCAGARPRRHRRRDVGAHKVWVARLYQAYEPNTVIISNGFAAMGIACPARSRRSSSTRTARSSPCAATAAS